MTLDPQLVAGWNAYPRCIYHAKRGLIFRVSGKPFKGPPMQPKQAADQGPPENDLGYEDELQFVTASSRQAFPFLLVEPGLLARRKAGLYSVKKLAQLLQTIFGSKVHATTLLRWLQGRPGYRAAKAARSAPRPRGRPRNLAPTATAAKPHRGVKTAGTIDRAQELQAARAERALQAAEGPNDPASGTGCSPQARQRARPRRPNGPPAGRDA